MSAAGETIDAAAYNAVVHAWCVCDRPEAAERLIERMLGDGVKPNGATYPDIVHAWARAGEFTRVERIIQRIETVAGASALGEKVYHAFIAGLCEAWESSPHQSIPPTSHPLCFT